MTGKREHGLFKVHKDFQCGKAYFTEMAVLFLENKKAPTIFLNITSTCCNMSKKDETTTFPPLTRAPQTENTAFCHKCWSPARVLQVIALSYAKCANVAGRRAGHLPIRRWVVPSPTHPVYIYKYPWARY